MRLTKSKKLLFFIILVLSWFLFYLAGVYNYFTIAFLVEQRNYLQAFVENHYAWSVISYMVLYIALVSTALPVALVSTVAGGFLFGALYGMVYSVIAATIGASILFYIIRSWYSAVMHQRYSHHIQWLATEFKRYGPWYLLAVRLSMVFPFFLINLLAPLLPVSLVSFAWTTMLGIMPGSYLYAYAGSQLLHMQHVSDLISAKYVILIIFFCCMALLPVLLGHLGIIKAKKL